MKRSVISKQIIWRTAIVLITIDLITAFLTTYILSQRIQKQQKNENLVVANMIVSSLKEAERKNNEIEEILDANLYTASKGINTELSGKELQEIDEHFLLKLTEKWNLDGISLLVKEQKHFRIAQSSEKKELNLSTKNWSEVFNTSLWELQAKKNVTAKEGYTDKYYWVSPVFKSDWSNNYYVYGYYFDGTTPFIINPYINAKKLLGHAMEGTNNLIDSIVTENGAVRNISVVNIQPFLKQKVDVTASPDTTIPIVAGKNEFPSDYDSKALHLLQQTGKEQSYTLGDSLVKIYVTLPEQRALLLIIDTSEQKRLQVVFILIFLAVIFLALSINIFLIRRIFKSRLKPLEQIGQYIEQVSFGKFDGHLDIPGNNELGWIAEHIKQMAKKIEGLIDELNKKAENAIYRMAYYDELTELPNRRFLGERLQTLIERGEKDNTPFSILFLDLDGFKHVNDTLGHKMGDRLLQEVTKSLQICIGDVGVSTRWAGDEFVLLLEHLDSRIQVEEIAYSIIHAISELRLIDGKEIHVTASIGIAIYPQDAKEGEALLTCADHAMYQAKESGKNRYCFYSDMDKLSKRME